MTTATLYLAFRLSSGTILVFCLIFLISENAAAPFADSKREIQGRYDRIQIRVLLNC